MVLPLRELAELQAKLLKQLQEMQKYTTAATFKGITSKTVACTVAETYAYLDTTTVSISRKRNKQYKYGI